ncbi:hypothetical protein ACWCQW_47255 [Streptomyces mirabilis]
MDKPQRGYWCECWTEDLTDEIRPALRASFDACTATQADRWIAVALRTISPALDADASRKAWTRLPLAHRQDGELSACADDLEPHFAPWTRGDLSSRSPQGIDPLIVACMTYT